MVETQYRAEGGERVALVAPQQSKTQCRERIAGGQVTWMCPFSCGMCDVCIVGQNLRTEKGK